MPAKEIVSVEVMPYKEDVQMDQATLDKIALKKEVLLEVTCC